MRKWVKWPQLTTTECIILPFNSVKMQPKLILPRKCCFFSLFGCSHNDGFMCCNLRFEIIHRSYTRTHIYLKIHFTPCLRVCFTFWRFTFFIQNLLLSFHKFDVFRCVYNAIFGRFGTHWNKQHTHGKLHALNLCEMPVKISQNKNHP